jgi:hypothetical protein
VAGLRWSGLRGRWHVVLWLNAGELVLGQGWECAGAYGRDRCGLYSRGRGVDTARAGLALRACSGVARARRTRGRVHLPEFLRL